MSINIGVGAPGYADALEAMFSLLGARSAVAPPPGGEATPGDVAFFNQVQVELLFPGGTDGAAMLSLAAVERLANLVAAATEIAYAATLLDQGAIERPAAIDALRYMTGLQIGRGIEGEHRGNQ